MWKWDQGKLSTWTDSFEYLPVGNKRHEELAKSLEGKQLSTVLILADHLADELWEDPVHCYKELHILVSKVEEEARKKIGHNGYFTKEEILEMCEKFKLDISSHSYTEEENRKHWYKLEDSFIELKQRLLLPEIFKSFKRSFKEDDPDTLEEREAPLTKEQLKESWPDFFLKIMAPRTSRSYKRVYDFIPKPMSHWDSRHSWQQYFFVSDAEGAPIHWMYGGYASSGAREHQGLMAHTFSTLDNIAKIPTLVARYTAKNILQPEVKFDSFKTQPQELSGNYHGDRGLIKTLFKGKLISVERTPEHNWGAVSELEDATNAY
jgi:hypothetical protein